MSDHDAAIEQRALDALGGEPKRFRDLCEELAPAPDGQVARVLSMMRARGMVDHRGAEWFRTAQEPAAPAPVPTSTDAQAPHPDPALRCPRPGCTFQAANERGLRTHLALATKHRGKRVSSPVPRRAAVERTAPVTPKTPTRLPPAEPVLDRVRRLRDAAAQAVHALEALEAAGFVV